tara:strand:+ start:3192 stop:3920 length:729 start_codon:yes stop_codon:yes gene_type:complete
MNEETIEKFSPLSVPFLGPIEFQDKESGEKLGEYPKNWESNNNFGTNNPEDIEVTVVQINRGPQGVPGEAGTPSGVGICEGRIDIESIDTDKLDINVNEINMIADRINIKNKICIGDNCLDGDLINQIKYSNSQATALESAKNEISELTRTNASLSQQILEINIEKAELEKPDKSFISSINKDTPENNIEISGNALEFTGNRVNFENQFCVGNFCLTQEDLEKISQHPEGEPGEAGICADAV